MISRAMLLAEALHACLRAQAFRCRRGLRRRARRCGRFLTAARLALAAWLASRLAAAARDVMAGRGSARGGALTIRPLRHRAAGRALLGRRHASLLSPPSPRARSPQAFDGRAAGIFARAGRVPHIRHADDKPPPPAPSRSPKQVQKVTLARREARWASRLLPTSHRSPPPMGDFTPTSATPPRQVACLAPAPASSPRGPSRPCEARVSIAAGMPISMSTHGFAIACCRIPFLFS